MHASSVCRQAPAEGICGVCLLRAAALKMSGSTSVFLYFIKKKRQIFFDLPFLVFGLFIQVSAISSHTSPIEKAS